MTQPLPRKQTELAEDRHFDRSAIDKQSYSQGYQQALADYCIKELLEYLNQFEDEDFSSAFSHLTRQESSLIAALFIQQLTQNSINGKLLTAYLSTIRQSSSDNLSSDIALAFPQSPELPADFIHGEPTVSQQYSFGEKVSLVPVGGASESGTVVGYYFGYAWSQCRWCWHYVIWLSKSSLFPTVQKVTIAREEEIRSEMGL